IRDPLVTGVQTCALPISPRGKPPDFTYRALPSTRRLLERTPVRVQGRLVLRSTVIAHAGDAALWPLGRLRRPGRKIRRERRSLRSEERRVGRAWRSRGQG